MPTETKDKTACCNLVKQARKKPVRFLEKVTGEHYWSKEKEILRALRDHRDVTVRSCHGSGKTFTAARAALQFFLAWPNSVVLSTAPTFSQVKHQLWRELHTAVNACRIPILKRNQTALEEDNEWYALGLSTNDTDNFQGFHQDYILAIVDESSGVDQDIFDAVDSVLTSEHSKRLYIGNPLRRSGEFYRSHQDPDYERIKISVFDTPNFKYFGITEDDLISNTWEEKINGPMPYPPLVTPRWAFQFQKKHPKGSMGYTIKISGEFPESAEDTFISQTLYEQAVKSNLKPEGPKELGVDPARFGNDQSGFAEREGPKLLKLWQRPITNEMEVAGEVIATIRKDKIDSIKIDTTGVGAGAYDRVKEVVDEDRKLRHVNLIEVKGGEKATDSEQYYNRASEVWGMIRERLQEGDIDLLENEDLKTQLTTRKYSYTSRGQIRLESKEDMKKRGLPSPDLGDAIGYAYYQPKSVDDYPSMIDRFIS